METWLGASAVFFNQGSAELKGSAESNQKT